jgi:hypothetical protein
VKAEAEFLVVNGLDPADYLTATERTTRTVNLTWTPSVIATNDPVSGDIKLDAGRCKDCKHWGVTESWINSHGEQSHSPPTICHRKHVKDCARVNGSELTETVGEPCGDQGTILTHGDFGCVLWEAKP